VRRACAALLALQLSAGPALAAPTEVPKVNANVGTGMPGAGVPSLSPDRNAPGVETTVPSLGDASLVMPDEITVEEGGAGDLTAQARPARNLGVVAPAGKIVPRRRADGPAGARAEIKTAPEAKAEDPAPAEKAPEVGAKRMREALESLREDNTKIRGLLEEKTAAPGSVQEASVVGSRFFDAAKAAAGRAASVNARPIRPRRRGSNPGGLQPASPGGRAKAGPSAAAPAPAAPNGDAHLRTLSRRKSHARLNVFLGKAVYFMTGGSFGILPRTYGKNADGDPLVILERRAIPFSQLLPRKLRHALFGRHWISIGVNEAPDLATKKDLIEAFRSLGRDENLDYLKTGWAGGAAGFRAITANPALINFVGRHSEEGWEVLEYRGNAALGDRLMTWWQHPLESPALAARALWAKLRGRAPPEDPRRILSWTDPDPEPANRLPLYLLKLPLRFAGSVVEEIFGDASNRHYTVRALASIPLGLDRGLRKVLPFYGLLPQWGMTPKRLLARANRIALRDPKRVIGIFDEKEIECQTASDCAVRASYNHPRSEPIRRAMDYQTFLNFAEAAVNTPLRDTGTTYDRRRAYMDLLGFDNGAMRYVEQEDELVEALFEEGPQFGRMHFWGSRLGSLITFSGWNPSSSHLVVVNGAIRETGVRWMWTAARNAGLLATARSLAGSPVATLKRLKNDGVWTFVVTDSNFRRPQRYTYRQLETMGLAIGNLTLKKNWRQGVGFRLPQPGELHDKIEKTMEKFGGVRVPRQPGVFRSLARMFFGPRWRALPSDGPVLVPAKKRIGLEVAGRPWKGGKQLEILAVDLAKKRFENLAGEPALAEPGVTHVVVDPLNPKQFRPLVKDGGEVWIGRGNPGRFLFSERVSRAHLSIIPMGEHFIIQDHDSANGTRIARVKAKPVDVSLESPTTRNPKAKNALEELADKDVSDGAGFARRRPRRGRTLWSAIAEFFESRRAGDLGPGMVFGATSEPARVTRFAPVGSNPHGAVGKGRIAGRTYYFKVQQDDGSVKFTPEMIEREGYVGAAAYELYEAGMLPEGVEVVRSAVRPIFLRATGRYSSLERGAPKGALVEARAVVSEPAPGVLLDQFHEKGGRLSGAEIDALARAVGTLHENGVAHGDLSGANIAVLDDPRNWSRRVLTLYDFDFGAVRGDARFAAAVEADLAALARMRSEYAGTATARNPLFDNRMRAKSDVARVFGFDPGLEEGTRFSSEFKGSTHVKEIRPQSGPRRIVKWFQEGAQGADELFMRRVFERFPQLSRHFATANAVGYRHGPLGRRATLVMERVDALSDGRRFVALEAGRRIALALTQVFGLSDFNPGSMLFPASGKPVVLDFEKLGANSPTTGRLPIGLILQEMPWVPRHHFATYDEYAPLIEEFRKEFTKPETRRELLAMLRESGHSPLGARSRLNTFSGNLADIEAILRADIDLANQYVEREGADAGLSPARTRAWSDLNRILLDNDEGPNLRNFVRAVNTYFLDLEGEGAKWLAGRAEGPALEAGEFAYFLKNTGGVVDEKLLQALARDIEVPGIEGLRRHARALEKVLASPSSAPSIPPAATLSVGRR
jgi:hypothetical protein